MDKPVADYLERERKREQAQERRDKRYLSDKDINRYDFDEYIADKPVDMAEWLVYESEIEGLLKAITCLSEDEQTIIINRYFKGKELTEIAESYGVTYQAIQKRIRTILKRLRKFLS